MTGGQEHPGVGRGPAPGARLHGVQRPHQGPRLGREGLEGIGRGSASGAQRRVQGGERHAGSTIASGGGESTARAPGRGLGVAGAARGCTGRHEAIDQRAQLRRRVEPVEHQQREQGLGRPVRRGQGLPQERLGARRLSRGRSRQPAGELRRGVRGRRTDGGHGLEAKRPRLAPRRPGVVDGRALFGLRLAGDSGGLEVRRRRGVGRGAGRDGRGRGRAGTGLEVGAPGGGPGHGGGRGRELGHQGALGQGQNVRRLLERVRRGEERAGEADAVRRGDRAGLGARPEGVRRLEGTLVEEGLPSRGCVEERLHPGLVAGDQRAPAIGLRGRGTRRGHFGDRRVPRTGAGARRDDEPERPDGAAAHHRALRSRAISRSASRCTSATLSWRARSLAICQ